MWQKKGMIIFITIIFLLPALKGSELLDFLDNGIVPKRHFNFIRGLSSNNTMNNFSDSLKHSKATELSSEELEKVIKIINKLTLDPSKIKNEEFNYYVFFELIVLYLDIRLKPIVDSNINKLRTKESRFSMALYFLYVLKIRLYLLDTEFQLRDYLDIGNSLSDRFEFILWTMMFSQFVYTNRLNDASEAIGIIKEKYKKKFEDLDCHFALACILGRLGDLESIKELEEFEKSKRVLFQNKQLKFFNFVGNEVEMREIEIDVLHFSRDLYYENFRSFRKRNISGYETDMTIKYPDWKWYIETQKKR